MKLSTLYNSKALVGLAIYMSASSVYAAAPNAGAVPIQQGGEPQVQFLQQQQGGQTNVESQQMYDHFELQDERAIASKQRLEISSLPGMQRAVEDANRVINACDDKLANGMLKNYLAAVRCSNTQMIHIFQLSFYPHLDLIEGFAAKRESIARRLDNHEITYSEKNDLLNSALNYIYEQERARAITTQDGKVSPY